jgi:hypothetical protein
MADVGSNDYVLLVEAKFLPSKRKIHVTASSLATLKLEILATIKPPSEVFIECQDVDFCEFAQWDTLDQLGGNKGKVRLVEVATPGGEDAGGPAAAANAAEAAGASEAGDETIDGPEEAGNDADRIGRPVSGAGRKSSGGRDLMPAAAAEPAAAEQAPPEPEPEPQPADAADRSVPSVGTSEPPKPAAGNTTLNPGSNTLTTPPPPPPIARVLSPPPFVDEDDEYTGMTLHVLVHSADELQDVQSFSPQDPYVKVTVLPNGRVVGPNEQDAKLEIQTSTPDGLMVAQSGGDAEADEVAPANAAEAAASATSYTARTACVEMGGICPHWDSPLLHHNHLACKMGEDSTAVLVEVRSRQQPRANSLANRAAHPPVCRLSPI